MALLKSLTVLVLTLHLLAAGLVFLFPPLLSLPDTVAFLLVRLLAGFVVFKICHSIPVSIEQSPVLAFLLSLSIPISVAGNIPAVLQQADHISKSTVFSSDFEYLAAFVGCILGSIGIGLLLWTSQLFHVVGKGTLSPDENLCSSRLILVGPYKYSRNPMITGAALALAAHALVANSPRIMCFAIAFVPIKTWYFIYVEEPGLVQKFGSEYVEYKQHVPRWIPALTAYNASETKKKSK